MRRFLGVLVVLAACTVGDIDYTGKRCPCPDAWVCVSDVCQRSAGGSSALSGAIRVTNLRAAWATPNTIRWEWDVEGDTSHFGRLELDVTSTTPGAGGAKRWTSTERPELGRPTLQTRGGADIRVTSTSTDGHDPDTAYVATLTAYDDQSRPSVSNPAGRTTQVALSRRIVLFSEERPAGYPLPSNLTIESGCGAAGTERCIRYTPETDPEKSCTAFGCGQNLRWQGFDVATADVDAGVFADRAYAELYLRSTGTTTSYYSLLWLYTKAVESEPCDIERANCLYELNAWTFKPQPTYRRMQVPLRVLQNGAAELLTHERFARGLVGFNVYASWDPTATIEIDEVSVFY